jgi:hypothetical protein
VGGVVVLALLGWVGAFFFFVRWVGGGWEE